MGLDVYLLEKETEERADARNKQWNELYERKKKGEIDEEEYKRLAAESPWEPYPTVESKYGADHLYNRRYLRSSYNGGGFNWAVPELINEPGKDLYWVFGDLDTDQYPIELSGADIPALRHARKRALYLAKKLRDERHALRTMTVTSMFGDKEHLWKEPPTAEEALEWYREQLARGDSKVGGSWSNARGTFLGSADEENAGIRVVGAVVGRDILGGPAAHLIYQDPDSVEHYAECADITAEFCEEAIELVRRDGLAYIHWSA